jgi:hypothetical protein
MKHSFGPHTGVRAASAAAISITLTVSTVVLISALPAVAVSGPAVTASVQLSAPQPLHATKLPNASIEWNKKRHFYSPKSLKATWSGSSDKKCTTAKQRITISNPTKNTQTVTYEGNFLVSLPAGYQFGACFWGTGVGTFLFGVDKSKADLTVSVS